MMAVLVIAELAIIFIACDWYFRRRHVICPFCQGDGCLYCQYSGEVSVEDLR